MPLSHTLWTAEMLNERPDDGNRYEVLDGALLVTPAPSVLHQKAASRLFTLIAPYAIRLGLDPLFAPTAVRFSERREVQPDLLVSPGVLDGNYLLQLRSIGVILLAVEILSPGSLHTDRHGKRQLYQEENVREYWIVDTESRAIKRWTPDAAQSKVCTSTLAWQPMPKHAPLNIDVVQYFCDVWGE